MELANLIAFSDNVKFEEEHNKTWATITAIGNKEIEKYKNIIDNYNCEDIEINGGEYYARIAKRTTKILKLEYKDKYEAWKTRQDEYRKKLDETLKNLEDLGYQISNIEILLPEEFDDKDEWYDEENMAEWTIIYNKNSQLYKELEKLKVKEKL